MQPRFHLVQTFLLSPLGLQIKNDISLIDDITHPGFVSANLLM